MTAPPLLPPPPPPPPRRRPRSTAWAVVVVILGVLAGLVATGLLAGGGALMYADRALRDAAGYLTSPTAQVAAPDYAIAATDVNLAVSDPAWHVSSDALGSVRVTATGRSSGAIFLGVAPRAALLSYLRGTAYDEPTQWLGHDGFAYRSHAGAQPLTAPGDQTFWVAQASGPGTQTLTWKVESGEWGFVLMNANASRGVAATLSVGATAPFLFGVALALLIGGAAVLIGAALLLLFGVHLARPGAASPRSSWPPAPAPAGSGWAAAPPAGGGVAHPLRLEGQLEASPSRWLWLVKWILLIPHLIVLWFLATAGFLLTVIAFFAILLTGRYPRGIFEFNVGVLRWWWRVSFYGYSALGTDRYPPFSLAPDPAYPATLEVAYPEHLSRGLALVKWWLLAIPQYLVVALLVGGATIGTNQADYTWEVPYTGLITVLVLIAAIAVTFTRRYPRGLFDLVMGLNRWVYRVLVYVLLMRDEYPPFRLDMGGSEPQPQPVAPEPTGPMGWPRPYGV